MLVLIFWWMTLYCEFFLIGLCLCIFLFLSDCFDRSSLIFSYYKEKEGEENKASVFAIQRCDGILKWLLKHSSFVLSLNIANFL